MHARHRNTGNGYRAGSMGMGFSSSRAPPEGSVRGHGLYGSSVHRNFNRGFGRGQGHPKPHHPTPPMPPSQRKADDILMEAGRLAAEYLVSQGVLPPSALSSKWQSGSTRKQLSEFQDSRSQEVRMGGSSSHAGRRRYSDEYGYMGSRSHLKGKKKGGNYGYGSDSGRGYGRSGSWSDRDKAPEMEIDGNSSSGRHEEHPVAEDISSSLHRSASAESSQKCEGAGESELEKYNLQDEVQSKTGSSSAAKEPVNDGEISKVSEGSSSLSAGTGELKDSSGLGTETENRAAMEGSSVQESGLEDEPPAGVGVDLLRFCKFAKVPTRTRSSLTLKGSKVDSKENTEGSTPNVGLLNGIELPSQCDSPAHSSGKTQDHDCLENEASKSVLQVENVGEPELARGVEKTKFQKSQSFPESILRDDKEKESCLELPDLQRTYSMGKERGEKRILEDTDSGERSKKRKEWFSTLAPKVNDSVNISQVTGNKAGLDEKTPATGEKILTAIDHASLISNFPSSKGRDGESSVGYAGREPFSSSFKICDLNLVGAFDVNENNASDSLRICPSIPVIKKETSSGGFGLSMSSSSKLSEFTTRISNGKEIEVIDLEDDSPEQAKADCKSDIRPEAPFIGFSRQSQTGDNVTDVHDFNEGNMKVEFLDSFGNIPAGINPVSEGLSNTPQDVSPLQNEFGIQNSEGTLGADQETPTDDDSIFMSLGEIPLTFLHAWDQPPTRGYEKPF